MLTNLRSLNALVAALFALGFCYQTANALPAPTQAPSTVTSVESPRLDPAKVTEANASTATKNATLKLQSRSGGSAASWSQSPNYSASSAAERSGSKSKLVASGLALLAIGAPVVLFHSRGHENDDPGIPSATTPPAITNPGPGDPPDPIDDPIAEPPTFSSPDPEPVPITVDATSLPEPGTLSLLGAGLAALVAFRRRR